MKRQIIFFIVFVFASLEIASSALCNGVYAATNAVSEEEALTPYYNDESLWYNEGNVCMPINSDNDKWDKSPEYIERVKLCIAPTGLLDKLSTKELALLVLECPLGRQLVLWNGVEDGMNTLKKDFNVLQSLLERDDCGEVVLDLYENYIIPSEKAFDSSLINEECSIEEFNNQAAELLKNDVYFSQLRHDANVRYAIAAFEWILSQNNVVENMNYRDCENAISIMAQKLTDKQASEYNNLTDDYFFKCVESNKNNIATLYDVQNNSLYATLSNRSTEKRVIKTPSGNALVITIENNPKTASREQSLQDLGEYKDYIGLCVFLLQERTTKFNCYAYAWFTLIPQYTSSYARKCLLFNTNPLIDDPRIHKTTTPRANSVVEFAGHAIYVEEINYTYGKLGVHNDYLIKEKISIEGSLVKWPLSFSNKISGAARTPTTFYYYK